jgi:hypothetical protein
MAGTGDALEETLVDECGEGIEDRRGRSATFSVAPPYPFNPLQREAANEDGKAAEECLFGRREEVVGPGDGIGHRAQARRLVHWTTHEQRKLWGKPGQEVRWHQDEAAGGGELDGEGQPVHPFADSGDGRGILYREPKVSRGCRGPLDEKLDGLGPGQCFERRQLARSGNSCTARRQQQRRHGIDPLDCQMQRGAAGGEDCQARSRGQQVAQRRRSLGNLLEIVQDE